MKSLDSSFQIQGRFARFRANQRITVTRGIVLRTGEANTPIIQLDLPAEYDNQCKVDMYVNNIYRNIEDGSGAKSVVVTKLAWNKYTITYPWTGVDLAVEVRKSSGFGCFFTVKLCLPDDYRNDERIIGLLGSPNGNKFDDWMKADGTVLPFPSTTKTSRFQSAYEYCVSNWCIFEEAESLFEYNKTQKESFKSYFGCGDQYQKNIQTCAENPTPQLAEICGTNEECLIDGCGGDEKDAENSLVVEDTFVETRCAKEFLFEDFEGDYDNEWGQAAETGGTRYIGPLGKDSPKIHKEFDVPEDAESLTLEFLFYEFDDWQGVSQDDGGDKLYATVGDVRLDLERFDQLDSKENPNNEQSGKFGDVAWSRFSVTESKDIALGGSKDQVHKVTIRVPPNQFSGGKLVFEFELEMSGSINEASGGLDNFRIIAHFPCKGDLENKELNDNRISLPRKCAGYKASWKGDPHMVTFDGLKYDCQGAGEFLVMKSLESDFTIQGRFVKFLPERKPTVTKSVVIKAGGKIPPIQVNVPSTATNGVCKPYAYIDENPRDIVGLDKDQEMFQSEVLSEGDKVGLVLFFVESKVQVTMWAKKSSTNGCVLGTSVCIEHDSPMTGDSFVGLLGTPNGDMNDDWMSIEATGVSVPKTTRERLVDAYDYCVDNWCIRNEEESLFAYDEDQDESFDAFEDCSPRTEEDTDTVTIDCVEKAQEDPSSELAKICGSDYACLVDGCVGNKEDAQRQIGSENDEADYGCAEQIEFEDFGHRYTGSWGLKAEQDNAFGSPFLRLHKKQSEIIKDVTVPSDADLVTIEFAFYEIDQWEEEDMLKVLVKSVERQPKYQVAFSHGA